MSDASADWEAQLDRLAARHPVVRRARGWLCLGWPAQGAEPGQAPEQTVQVTRAERKSGRYILLTADLVEAGTVSERDALELAAKLLLGNVLIQKNILTIRCALAERCPPEIIDEAIFTLRNNAIRMRSRLIARRDARQRDAERQRREQFW